MKLCGSTSPEWNPVLGVWVKELMVKYDDTLATKFCLCLAWDGHRWSYDYWLTL